MLTCGQVAAHFEMMAAGGATALLEGVVVSVVEAAKVEAKSYIGHQQEGWEDLHDPTIEGFHHELGFWVVGKKQLGFQPPDYEPLRRTGQLRESIETRTEGLVGEVGSNDKVALYQEMGTANAHYPIPPRPFLSRAMMLMTPMAIELCEEATVRILVPVS